MCLPRSRRLSRRLQGRGRGCGRGEGAGCWWVGGRGCMIAGRLDGRRGRLSACWGRSGGTVVSSYTQWISHLGDQQGDEDEAAKNIRWTRRLGPQRLIRTSQPPTLPEERHSLKKHVRGSTQPTLRHDKDIMLGQIRAEVRPRSVQKDAYRPEERVEASAGFLRQWARWWTCSVCEF